MMKNTIGIVMASLFVISSPCFAGDSMNLDTGEYHMDIGGGDSMNLDTGEYHMDMGGD